MWVIWKRLVQWSMCLAVAYVASAQQTEFLPPGYPVAQAKGYGFVSTLVGQPEIAGFVNGAKQDALLDTPGGIAVDAQGIVYVADVNNHAIRAVFPNGTTYTIAGTGVPGFLDGPTATARFSSPHGVAIHNQLLVVADTNNHAIRAISLTINMVSTIAGGTPGFVDGTGTLARFFYPWQVTIAAGAWNPTGSGVSVLVPDRFNHRLRLVANITSVGASPGTPNTAAWVTVSTVAGTGSSGYSDGGLGTGQLYFPSDVTVRAGDFAAFIVHNHCVRKLTAPPGLQLSTLAGVCSSPGLVDGTGSAARFYGPEGIHADSQQSLYVADRTSSRIRILNSSTAAVSTWVGSDPLGAVDGNPLYVSFLGPSAVTGAAFPTNSTWLYITDTDNSIIRQASGLCKQPCINGGTCVGTDTCACVTGYNGSFCEVAFCDPPCTDGKLCALFQFCRCPLGYNGPGCASPICDNITCVHGNCSSPNKCTCETGWTRDNCTVPHCAQTCLNGGVCTAPNTCTCPIGWIDSNCSTAVCNGTCLNGGQCTAPDTCTCTSEWTGQLCETPVCVQLCENGGNCTSPNNCTCPEGWVGDNCTIPICDPPCNPVGGTCVAAFTCECLAGWSGPLCTGAICANVVCENGGVCQSPNNCSCAAGWSGVECTEPICDSPACGLGQLCSQPNTCISACFVPCLNSGTCIGPDNCSCAVGWEGAQCGQAICTQGCVNGQCVQPDVCQCATGYHTADCSQPVCTGGCLNGGSCISPDNCRCVNKWRGDNCEIAFCNGDQLGCLHGDCVAPDVCNCTVGWSGGLCSVPLCTSPCRNGGECVGPDLCSCLDGFSGSDCSISAQTGTSFWDDNGPFFYFSFAFVFVFAVLYVGWRWRVKVDKERLEQARAERLNAKPRVAIDESDSTSSSDVSSDEADMHNLPDVLSPMGDPGGNVNTKAATLQHPAIEQAFGLDAPHVTGGIAPLHPLDFPPPHQQPMPYSQVPHFPGTAAAAMPPAADPYLYGPAFDVPPADVDPMYAPSQPHAPLSPFQAELARERARNPEMSGMPMALDAAPSGPPPLRPQW